MMSFQKSPAVLRKRRIWPLWAYVFATLGALPFAIRWVDDVFPVYLGGGGVLCAVCLFACSSWVDLSAAELTAERSGLYLNGRRELARGSVRAASLQHRDSGVVVRLVTFWRPFEVLVDDVREGNRLLAALGLSSRTSVARYFMLWGRYRESLFHTLVCFAGMLVSTLCVAAAVVLGALPERPGAAMFAALVPLGFLYWLLGRLVVTLSVGPDGISLRRGLARARFIPLAVLAAIDVVERQNTDVFVRLRDGSSIVLSLGPQLFRRPGAAHATPDEIIARVTDALASHRCADAVRNALARGGRGAAEWIDGVRALAGGASSYRQAAVPRDVLWHVLEDPRASETERAGSAIALQARLDVAERIRICEVGDACVSPRLRVALRLIGADESAERLNAALSMIVDADAQPIERPGRKISATTEGGQRCLAP